MARTNPRVHNFPNLWRLACAIQKVMERSGVLEIWRDRVLAWSKEQLGHHKLRERHSGVDGEDPEVEVKQEHWLTPGDLIPLPYALTIEGKYVVLAAVYDLATGEHDGIETIQPRNSNSDWIPFEVVKISIENMGDISDDNSDKWFSCLEKVQSDLNLPTHPSGAEQSPDVSQAGSEVPVISAKHHSPHGIEDVDKKLIGWREILAAIERPFSVETKRQIARLNELNGGPMPKPGRGKQPIVSKNKWLEWWNGIEHRKQELEQRQLDSQASTSDTYKHGHSAVVVPGINGSIKQKKAKGNQT